MLKNGNLVNLIDKSLIIKKSVYNDKAKILKYERGHVKMSNSNINPTQPTPNLQQVQPPTQSSQPPTQSPQPVHESLIDKKSLINTIIGGVVVAGILGAFSLLYNTLIRIDDNLSILNSSSSAVQADINNLKKDVEKLENNTIVSIDTNEVTTKLIPTELITNSLDMSITKTSVSMPINLSALPLKDTDIIAKDSVGKEYTVRELINQKLLLPYESNGQEVYFYGQFNENNQWHGECIINVYKDNQLILITESKYDNGIVQSYKQALPQDKKSKSWIISDRQNRGNYNSGESWQYARNESEMISKSFGLETVSSVNMLTVGNFKESLINQLEGYYYGNTSDGKYNDTTGTAYFIKYDKFGNIETLYCGNFKNGYFEDNTNNAWSITRDVQSNSNYMYYKGKFKGGSRVNNTKPKLDLTLEEINTYIEGREFNAELKWALTDSL